MLPDTVPSIQTKGRNKSLFHPRCVQPCSYPEQTPCTTQERVTIAKRAPDYSIVDDVQCRWSHHSSLVVRFCTFIGGVLVTVCAAASHKACTTSHPIVAHLRSLRMDEGSVVWHQDGRFAGRRQNRRKQVPDLIQKRTSKRLVSQATRSAEQASRIHLYQAAGRWRYSAAHGSAGLWYHGRT